jgi:hypothetical protein
MTGKGGGSAPVPAALGPVCLGGELVGIVNHFELARVDCNGGADKDVLHLHGRILAPLEKAALVLLVVLEGAREIIRRSKAKMKSES